MPTDRDKLLAIADRKAHLITVAVILLAAALVTFLAIFPREFMLTWTAGWAIFGAVQIYQLLLAMVRTWLDGRARARAE